MRPGATAAAMVVRGLIERDSDNELALTKRAALPSRRCSAGRAEPWRPRYATRTLPNHRKKTVVLDAQQAQQLLISTMKDCPAHLRLYAVARLFQ
jgi:hypothetical protein